MSEYFDAFKIKAAPKTDDAFCVTLKKTRISVLTDSLVRVESSKSGEFCDEPTQSVWFRCFDKPKFESEIKGNRIVIKTSAIELSYNTAADYMEYIILPDGEKVTDYRSGNLKGTTRTLDQSFGSVSLDDGIMSESGVAVFDDSKSLILNEDGTVSPRSTKEKDCYYFAYGNNYRQALRDFFKLTGAPPLVPRFTLGNWWSRYRAYTQDEYVTLMKRFLDEEIPITVATIDMDWHWVDVKSKFGKDSYSLKDNDSIKKSFYDAISNGGWTGYSWNTDLFPDYKAFLKWLQSKNFKVTMNLHPASGVRWFEDMYSEFAEFMGDDPELKKTYPFDITDKKFVEGYFKILHKPYEKDGVDFWWIDWQQGTKSNIPGLDPLWALNHYHSMDLARDGDKRPLILSRFAGAGSHRYALGFSGDTAQSWKVLDFQPYFTSTATNIGYTWWSHDIGGHHFGVKNDELYLRWVQYGVFSPIMRLHSTSNEFMGKEPWKYSKPIEILATDALRFRHRLIPYIYSMNYRTHHDGLALVEPMYYAYPDTKEAYNCKNEFMFGSELIVCPITSPVSKKTNMAGTQAWLPEGRYTDIFTGRIYHGGTTKMFRDISTIPVLAKEGAIIPLDVNDRINDWKNPKALELLIYRGKGSFSMYEDDGESMKFEKGAFAQTVYEVKENGKKISFVINAATGDNSVLPKKRSYKLSFKDVVSCKNISVIISGLISDFKSYSDKGTLAVEIDGISPDDKVEITLDGVETLRNVDKRIALTDCISKFQGKNEPKKKLYTDYVMGKEKMPSLEADLREPLEEIENLVY